MRSFKVKYFDKAYPNSNQEVIVAGYKFTNNEITEIKEGDVEKLKIILKRPDMSVIDERENTPTNVHAETKPKAEKTKAKPTAKKEATKQAASAETSTG